MKHLHVFVLGLCSTLPHLIAAGVGCESSPAVEAAQRDLDEKAGVLAYQPGLLFKEQAYRQMALLDPLDDRPLLRFIRHIRYDATDQWDALREKTIADAQSHPEDPVKQVAAALMLEGKDTPEAFHTLERVIARNPDYAPAYVRLAGMYSSLGKFIDKDKVAVYLGKYYRLCSSGRDSEAMRLLKKFASSELRTDVAKNLRQRLSTGTDPDVLTSYSDVWSLEFSTLPVAEHPNERRRVQEDLTRLEALKLQATAAWLDFQKDGIKQSGATELEVRAMQDRISKEFPHSDEAFEIWYQGWQDEHPQPAGEAPAAEWQQYMRAALAHYSQITSLFPQEHGFGYYLFEYTSHLEGAANAEIIRIADAYIKDGDVYDGPSASAREHVARVLLERGLDSARALALLQQARGLRDSPRENIFNQTRDYSTDKDIQKAAKSRAIGDAMFRLEYLKACRAAGDKPSAESMMAGFEAAPADPEAVVPYWEARAVFAEIEGRSADALAFYQKALFLRTPPAKQYGVLKDSLLADARRLWTESQGSEAAFAIWSQPDNSTKPALAEGRWEKPDKELPAFDLTDLQGKTWKLTSLEGKKVLINIWATWCGPCQAELPHFEKLYEQTKGRSDIVMMTLNFDEDVGLVEPFVKKKGFTFPVVPAYALLAAKIDVNSIPRNWLVSANGKWMWEQIGFDSTEPDWEKSMLSRLENTK